MFPFHIKIKILKIGKPGEIGAKISTKHVRPSFKGGFSPFQPLPSFGNTNTGTVL